MNYFENRINNILNKYFFIKEGYEDIDIRAIIGSIIQKNSYGNFAIWGAGTHTQVLYKNFSFDLKKCKCIVDNNKKLQGKNYLGFEVISPDNLFNYDIDTIFISSYGGKIDIKRQSQSLLPRCKVIDFYDILEKEYDTKLSGPFYLEDNIYINLFKLKKAYEIEKNLKERQAVLEKIIYLYIKIRDFYNARFFINLYIEKGYQKKESFIKLLKELDELLFDLKERLIKRKGNDIFLLFIDALRAKDVYNNLNMKFLNNILNESKYFKNAFSPSIYTFESVPSILTGKLPFYDELYKRKTLNYDEVPFIQKALNEGYSINMYFVDHWNVISGDSIHYGKYSPIMSKNIWNALCDLAENKNEKTIYFLYFLQETHPPHICGYHTVSPVGHNTPFTCNDIVSQSQQDYNTQYKDCLKYVDNQLECYFNIMGDDITKVIFSDHGQVVEDAMSDLKDISTLAGWHDDRYHIPLIISGSKVKSSKCNNIFSMIDFNNLIISLIDNKEYINNTKYIEVNFSKIYNAIIKKKYFKVGYEDYLYGFRVLRDNKYKLVITGNGKYKVYMLPEQFKECTNEEIREKVIEHFAKIVDISFPKLT